ncbi:response regulator, partial [Thermodesulfobacteriota bacterium]
MNTPVEILIVEDSRLQAKRLKRFLQDHGFVVFVAGNGKEGLAEAKDHRPHLVITDIIMPIMDGFEMCHAIRNDRHINRIPIIMVTSLSNPEDVLRGLEAGADSYITKPYEGKILLSRIEGALAMPRSDPDARTERKLHIHLGGKRYVINAGRPQILNLLLSTYEDAVHQNVK